jgi:hypothetical protein
LPEIWLNVWGNVCALISGEGVVHAEYGDFINADEERRHRATSCPDTGRSIRMAITPRMEADTAGGLPSPMSHAPYYQ